MRIVLSALVGAATLMPVPALAAGGDAQRMADELNNPATQERIAQAAEVMTQAMLSMPAAPLLRAAETMAGRDPEAVDPDLTVGDLAGPDAAEAPRELAHRLPEMMGAMAAMTAALETMLPELRAMGDRIAEDMARTTDR